MRVRVFACGSATRRKKQAALPPAGESGCFYGHSIPYTIAKGQLQIFGCQGSAQSDVFGRYSARSGCFPPLLRLIYIIHYLFFNLLTWGTLLFLGFVFNCVPRCLLFLILYLPLRIYAGGFHAKTKIGCYLISAFTFLFVVLYPADTTIHFYHLVFPCISTCIIYYFSPVSATNKPLDDLEALHYKKMARKILFSEILFFLLILLIFNTQITFAFFFSFTIHLSVLALQITVELVSKNFFANL